MVKKFIIAASIAGALVGVGAGFASAAPEPVKNNVQMTSGNSEVGVFACRSCYARGGSV